MQTGFYFDQSRCIGCYTCVAACRSWKELSPEMPDLIRIITDEHGEYPNVSLSHLFFTCFHCSEPDCVEACPIDLIQKRNEDGIVIIDEPQQCTGCELCLKACLYDAVRIFKQDPNHFLILKCDLCLDRLRDDKDPACVASCPVEALDVGPLPELSRKYGELKEIEGLPILVRQRDQ